MAPYTLKIRGISDSVTLPLLALATDEDTKLIVEDPQLMHDRSSF